MRTLYDIEEELKTLPYVEFIRMSEYLNDGCITYNGIEAWILPYTCYGIREECVVIKDDIYYGDNRFVAAIVYDGTNKPISVEIPYDRVKYKE